MANLNNIQSQLSNDTPYSRLSDRSYSIELTSTLPVEHTYQRLNFNSIQIALDFYSDKSEWTYVGTERIGDFKIQNVGTDNDKTSYSKIKRFESESEDTNHIIRCTADATYPNGFYPNIIYIGNHNLEFEDNVIFKAYTDSSFTTIAYQQTIRFNPKDIFYVNSRQFAKHKYFELEFVCDTSKVLKVGRIILAGGLPTNAENNAQMGISGGYTDNKDTMMTESKTLLFNRQFFGKKLNFSIQIDTNNQEKLAYQIEQLILEGTGSRPFLVILNPKDPNYLSLYGVLSSESSFEHKQLGYGLYSFDTEEIQ